MTQGLSAGGLGIGYFEQVVKTRRCRLCGVSFATASRVASVCHSPECRDKQRLEQTEAQRERRRRRKAA
jgi:hypothetical protein